MTITIYHKKAKEDKLEIINEIIEGSWVSLISPTFAEVEAISQSHEIPIDFFTDPLDIDEAPRVEIKNGCTLIIFRSSFLSENQNKYPFLTLPIGLILKGETIFTICTKESDIVSRFWRVPDLGFNLDRKVKLILKILQSNSYVYLKDLKILNESRNIIEEELHLETSNKKLLKLLSLEKSLVFFTTSLKGNDLVYNRLKRSWYSRMDEYELELIEDVIIDNRQAIETTEIYTSILMNTMTAFSSVIGNNLSATMKRLTALTMILMIPTVVTSAYGMNVPLPFETSGTSFYVVLFACLSLSFASALLFLKKRWL